MSKNEEKKAAPPPPARRVVTKLNLSDDDRRSSAGNIVHRTDGRRRDFAPGERIPKVGHLPLMLTRPLRDKRIEPAPLAERNSLHRALGHPDDSFLDAGARRDLELAVMMSARSDRMAREEFGTQRIVSDYHRTPN